VTFLHYRVKIDIGKGPTGGVDMAEARQDIIYNTVDGKAAVSLYAKDGMAWMNQNQIAQLFDTSKQNIGQHIANILKEKELDENSVVKNYLTTAAEIILDRADADKPNIALTSWPFNVIFPESRRSSWRSEKSCITAVTSS
jgi:hypothetical protein